MAPLKVLLYSFIALLPLHVQSMLQSSKSLVAPISALLVRKPSTLSAPLKNRLFHTVRNVPLDERYKPPFESERKKFYKQLKEKPWGSVSQKYIQHFQKENRQMMHDLCALAPGMTPINWHTRKFYAKGYYEQEENLMIENWKFSDEKIPQLLKDKITMLIRKMNIDPKEIKVFHTNKSLGVTQSILLIDECLCQGVKRDINNDIIDALILHEMQHILHDDSFLEGCVSSLYDLNKKMINKKNWFSFKKKLSHMKEKRADIFAGLVDLKCPSALSSFLQHNGSTSKDSLTHPAHSVRVAYLNKLHREMLEAIKNNKLRV